jgi:hypothetical protein
MRFRGAELVVLIILAFSGCTASGANPASPSPLQNDPAYLKAAKNPLPALAVHSTQKQLSAEYSASINGRGSDRVGEVSISGNVGSIQVSGVSIPTFVQENIPWTDMGYTLYQGLALDESHFYVYWIYCQAGEVASIFIEGAGGETLENEQASGQCKSTAQDTSFEVSTPDVVLPPIQPVKGFEIDGDNIYLAQSTGLGIVDLGLREKYLFSAFSRVDCSDCGQGGWQELHALFWNKSMSQVCFGILYLEAKDTTDVVVDYSMCFPDLERKLDKLKIQSTWVMGSNPTP